MNLANERAVLIARAQDLLPRLTESAVTAFRGTTDELSAEKASSAMIAACALIMDFASHADRAAVAYEDAREAAGSVMVK